jgi:hypothetical protein
VNRGKLHGRLRVLAVDDLDTATARGYLLKGLISPAEISIWVGPPKCGKSFLLLYVAYLLSLGISVFGRRVKKIRVLYVAAEGEGGIANRLKALRDRHGHSPNFHFIAQPADLLHQDGQLDDLIAAAKDIGTDLIVIDTLSRVLSGGDENSPQDMGMFICNVSKLRHDTGAHIAIVHHGTKASNGSNPRGHSSLTGAADVLIEVLKLEDGSRTATVVFAKDDPDGMRWAFTLDTVELGNDGDGDPITTLIVSEQAAPSAAGEKPPKLSSNQQIALAALEKALRASTTVAAVGEDYKERSVATERNWRDRFYQDKPGETPDTKRMAFTRARDDLIAKGRVASQHDFLWIVRP